MQYQSFGPHPQCNPGYDVAGGATAAQRTMDTAYLNPPTVLQIPVLPGSPAAPGTGWISDTALARPAVLGIRIALPS